MMKVNLLVCCIVLLLPCCVFAQLVARLEVYPSDRVLYTPGHTQQLAVIAHFADGSKRDVTRLATYSSSDSDIATITPNGQVRFHKPGEVAIGCRYVKVQPIQLTLVETKPGLTWVEPPANNAIDRLVYAKLKEMRLPPSDLAPDAMFLRRAYIDACGKLPTIPEVHRFMKDARPDKRARLIDELLQRPEFAERWAHHFVYSLGLQDDRALAPKNGAAYLHWMRGRILNDAPLNRVVRDMLLGVNVVTDCGPVSFYSGGRTPEDWAVRAAHNFLGIRLECARCHLHQRGRWTADDYHGLTAFFSQVRVERLPTGANPLQMLVLDKSRTGEWLHPETKKPVPPRFLDGTLPQLEPGQDRRQVFADWLTSPKNPYFARTLANRIWMHVLGRAVSDPPEELHELPFTSNDPLLDHLTQELIASKFSLKHLVRQIMNARVYQLSSIPNEHNKADDRYFSRVKVLPLDAEVMIDAVGQLCEVPLAIDGMPFGTRAMHVLVPGERAVFFRYRKNLPMCELEREPNLAAHLHFLNRPEIQDLIKHPHNRLGRLLAEKRSDAEILDELALAARSYVLAAEDRAQVFKHVNGPRGRREAWEDILWALMNMKDFGARR